MIGSDPSLQASIPAQLKYIPVQNGPSALAGYRSGAFEFVTNIGDPPSVGAINSGTKFHIIWPDSTDAAELVVHPGVNKVADLAGKTIGTLLGSTEAYELNGFLAHYGLTGRVKVQEFNSGQDVVPAFDTHKIDAAYDATPYTAQMKKNGGGAVLQVNGQPVTATYIGTLGYQAFNMISVADSFATKYPNVVQRYVCAAYRATKMLTGPRKQAVGARAARLTGEDPALASASVVIQPYVPVDKVVPALSPGGAVEVSMIRTSQYLAKAGSIPHPLAAKDVRPYITARWAQNAIAGKCG